MDGWMDRHMEIHRCVPQDIGFLGLLPCSHFLIWEQQQSRATWVDDHMMTYFLCLSFLLSPLLKFNPSFKSQISDSRFKSQLQGSILNLIDLIPSQSSRGLHGRCPSRLTSADPGQRISPTVWSFRGLSLLFILCSTNCWHLLAGTFIYFHLIIAPLTCTVDLV